MKITLEFKFSSIEIIKIFKRNGGKGWVVGEGRGGDL